MLTLVQLQRAEENRFRRGCRSTFSNTELSLSDAQALVDADGTRDVFDSLLVRFGHGGEEEENWQTIKELCTVYPLGVLVNVSAELGRSLPSIAELHLYQMQGWPDGWPEHLWLKPDDVQITPTRTPRSGFPYQLEFFSPSLGYRVRETWAYVTVNDKESWDGTGPTVIEV